MWMKITQNSAPGIGKAPLPGKTKDPQEPAMAGQLSFCWLDNRLIPRCDFLWNVYHFKLQSISAYQILFLDPSFALSERIQHGHHFFPLVFADLVACTAMSDSSVFAAHLWWTCNLRTIYTFVIPELARALHQGSEKQSCPKLVSKLVTIKGLLLRYFNLFHHHLPSGNLT